MPVQSRIPPPPAGAPALPGLSILIVDDDEMNLLMIEDMLDNEGASLVCVESGEQALARIGAGEEYDILLTDIQLSGMDGFETARAAHRLAPALPVVGITGHGRLEQRAQYLEAGLVDCLSKPYSREALIGMIRCYARGGQRQGAPAGQPEGKGVTASRIPAETEPRPGRETAPAPGEFCGMALSSTQEELLREVSHDLNNVVTAILGYADLAKNRFAPDGQGRLADYLNQLLTAGERARSLVMLLRTVLPPRSQPTPYCPAPLVHEVAALLGARAEAEEDEAKIAIDTADLRKALTTLVKAAQAGGGEVRIRLDKVAEAIDNCPCCLQPLARAFVELRIEGSGGNPASGTPADLAEIGDLARHWHGHFQTVDTHAGRLIYRLLFPRLGG